MLKNTSQSKNKNEIGLSYCIWWKDIKGVYEVLLFFQNVQTQYLSQRVGAFRKENSDVPLVFYTQSSKALAKSTALSEHHIKHEKSIFIKNRTTLLNKN